MNRQIQWKGDRLFFRRLVESAKILAWITEADGYCVYFSPAWYEFTGAPAGSGLGFDWLSYLHEDDVQRTRQTFFMANDSASEYGVSYRMATREGDYQLAWGHGIPRKTQDGVFRGYFGTTQILNPQTRQFALVGSKDQHDLVRPLSEREGEVLRLVADGLSNDDIALALGIARRTVEEHVRHAVEKLGAKNRVQAVFRATKMNLL